ncbi:MAG: DUF357 domain-containing protein [Nanoarchaeota archaeon]|nr:DUF357 domain-containing protein [Nanoarchaeota archaeon]
MKEITSEKISKYLDITKRALAKVKIISSERVKAEDALDMATRYFQDALHFHEKDDFVNAFACVNYAHGWLDAGARTGLFDVDGDSTLFTVDEKE